MIWLALSLVASTTVLALAKEGNERKVLFDAAYHFAYQSGKPLLVVGIPRGDYPCGDVTADINPLVQYQCPNGGEVIDVRSIPYQDKYFGAAFVSHVLEHLPSLADVSVAWRELWRVSDAVFVAYPRRYNLWAIVSPAHHLWVYQHLDNPRTLFAVQR